MNNYVKEWNKGQLCSGLSVGWVSPRWISGTISGHVSFYIRYLVSDWSSHISPVILVILECPLWQCLHHKHCNTPQSSVPTWLWISQDVMSLRHHVVNYHILPWLWTVTCNLIFRPSSWQSVPWLSDYDHCHVIWTVWRRKEWNHFLFILWL